MIGGLSLQRKVSFLKGHLAFQGNRFFGKSFSVLIFLGSWLFIFTPLDSEAKNYISTANGDWQASFNWTNNDWPKTKNDNATISHAIDVKKDQTVGKVDFNSGGDLKVQSNSTLTIDDTLDLTNGSITVKSGSSLVLTENATLSGVTKNNYIDGPYQRKGSDSLVFKLKGDKDIVNLTIHKLSSLSKYEVEYVDSTPQMQYDTTLNLPLKSISHEEYFQVNRKSGSGKARITLFWNGDGTQTPLSDLSGMQDLLMAHYNGSAWDSIGRHQTSGSLSSSGYITSDKLSSFSPFTFGTNNSNTSLPVELLYLEVDQPTDQSVVELKWATASETNNNYFEVQRKTGGKPFQAIGFIDGQGTSTERHRYNFDDPVQVERTIYYRLKQVDFDGTTHFSNVISVSPEIRDSSFDVTNITPNPVKDQATLTVRMPKAGILPLEIFNQQGITVKEHLVTCPKPGKHQIRVGQLTRDLNPGYYQLRIQRSSNPSSIAFIKR